MSLEVKGCEYLTIRPVAQNQRLETRLTRHALGHTGDLYSVLVLSAPFSTVSQVPDVDAKIEGFVCREDTEPKGMIRRRIQWDNLPPASADGGNNGIQKLGLAQSHDRFSNSFKDAYGELGSFTSRCGYSNRSLAPCR